MFYMDSGIASWAYLVFSLFLFLSLYITFGIKFSNQKKELNRLLKVKYSQLEMLSSLYAVLEIKKALPATGIWAADPDFLRRITDLFFQNKPKLIVEASSGVSSIVLGYCCKQLGAGKVMSLEHDLKYQKISQALIEEHELQDYVEIVYAPLVKHKIKDKDWEWYDISSLDNCSGIDMVIVDGPPFYLQKNSRYPVVPLLYDKMSDYSVLMLDDGIRQEEKDIAEIWSNEYKDISTEYLDLISGAILAIRNRKSD